MDSPRPRETQMRYLVKRDRLPPTGIGVEGFF